MSNRILNCPKCGESLDIDPDGGWCENCQEYWDNVELTMWNEEDSE